MKLTEIQSYDEVLILIAKGEDSLKLLRRLEKAIVLARPVHRYGLETMTRNLKAQGFEDVFAEAAARIVAAEPLEEENPADFGFTLRD